jgi:hypothetical protein
LNGGARDKETENSVMRFMRDGFEAILSTAASHTMETLEVDGDWTWVSQSMPFAPSLMMEPTESIPLLRTDNGTPPLGRYEFPAIRSRATRNGIAVRSIELIALGGGLAEIKLLSNEIALDKDTEAAVTKYMRDESKAIPLKELSPTTATIVAGGPCT